MSDVVAIALTVDATGLTCPLPLLKAKQGLKQIAAGECLKVIATDPGSKKDFEVFANLSGNHLLVSEQTEDTYLYVLQKS